MICLRVKKKIFMIIFVIKGIRLEYVFPSITDGGTALHQHWTNVSCYLGGGLSGDGGEKISLAALPRRMMSWAGVGIVLGQRRRPLTGIKPAMGCDAGLALSQPELGG